MAVRDDWHVLDALLPPCSFCQGSLSLTGILPVSDERLGDFLRLSASCAACKCMIRVELPQHLIFPRVPDVAQELTHRQEAAPNPSVPHYKVIHE
jgi:hypothetical protein